MSNYSISDVHEIYVTLKTGKKICYRGNGVNQFYRKVINSMQQPVMIIEDDEKYVEECPGGVCPVKKPTRTNSNMIYKTSDYHNIGGFDYTGNCDAASMKAQAEANGISF